MYLTGTEGDDILIGTADADTLVGLGGDDTLQGGDGDDLLMGGAGHNTLNGGAGNDTVSYADQAPVLPLFSFLMINLQSQSTSIVGPSGAAVDTLVSIENATGSASTDWLVGTTGDNVLIGGAGDDQINGWGGTDVLDGGDGNDSINTVFTVFPAPTGPATTGSLMIGGGGNDSIQSGYSNDTMLGGAGDDALTLGDFATTRIVDGGDGNDRLAFSDSPGGFANGVFVDLNKTTQTVAAGVFITLTNVENVNGTQTGDTLIGTDGANVMYGQGGDDWLYGRGGNDGINGGDGADYISGGAGVDNLYGGAGADTFSFAAGDTAGGSDTIQDFTAEDHLLFVDGPAGSSANYVELESIDFAAVSAAFAGDGVRYVAMQFGGSVLFFADDGDEGTFYDQTIMLTGTSLSSLDAGSVLGL